MEILQQTTYSSCVASGRERTSSLNGRCQRHLFRESQWKGIPNIIGARTTINTFRQRTTNQVSGLRPVHAPCAETCKYYEYHGGLLCLVGTESEGFKTANLPSSTYNESLVASNNAAFIPYIPGGTYNNLGTSQVISVTQHYLTPPNMLHR